MVEGIGEEVLISLECAELHDIIVWLWFSSWEKKFAVFRIL